MLLVITGAGSSFDSSASHPPTGSASNDAVENRPPLANQLFDERPLFLAAMDKFHQMKPLVTGLRIRTNEKTVEEVLGEISSRADTYTRGQTQLAAVQYYLQDSIWNTDRAWLSHHRGITNQTVLVDQIDKSKAASEGVLFVTFNYDLLLEDALKTVGINIASMSDYIKSDQYKLFKLHGSVNWVHRIQSSYFPGEDGYYEERARTIIEQFPTLQQHSSKAFEPIPHLAANTPAETGFLPAIAIPLNKKQTFECPNEHLTELVAFLPKVTKILVVGWKGAEDHFLTLLRKNLSPDVPILIVNGSVGEAEKAQVAIRQGGMYDFLSALSIDLLPIRRTEQGCSISSTQRFGRVHKISIVL